MNKYWWVGIGLILLTLKTTGYAANDLQAVIAAEHRSAANKARDPYRHPQQTLEFFDVKPNMTVVEIWPAQGWYTEILAPYLRDDGLLYAAHFSPDTKVDPFIKSLNAFKDKIQARPDLYDRLKLTVLQPPGQLEIAPKASVDRVLTFRNVHNWMMAGYADAVFQAMFDALKPGGILGIVEHRNPAANEQDPKAKNGYVTETYVIGLAEKAGFRLLDKSEINANPKDTHDHPQGVWTLPPSLRLQDQDREKYQAIGESDRMTLKFGKP